MNPKTLFLCGLFLLPLESTAVDYTFLPSLPVANPGAMPLLDIEQCGTRLLAVGERGLVIYSDDQGVNWTQADVPVSQVLTAVYCMPSGRSWAVGHSGVILASEDGGAHWSLQMDGDRANQQWLDYTQQQHAALETRLTQAPEQDTADIEYALEDALFAIEDAREALATGPADPFLDIWFRDEQRGIAVGAYGMLYRTADGGANWELNVAGIDNPGRYHYYSIASVGDGLIFLSGEAGLLYRSRDEGATWERLEPGYDGSLFGLVATARQTVLAFGLRGNILHSEDAGDSWQNVKVDNNPHLSLYGGARLADDSVALVGAAGVMLISTDHGRTFRSRILTGRNTLSAVAGAQLSEAQVVGMAGLENPNGAVP